MPSCPVCEHVQAAGAECEVCGRRLSGPGTEPAPVPALPGLEPTRLDAVPEAAPEPVEGLEPTLLEAVQLPDAPPEAWLEPDRAAALEVPVEAVAELEQHRAAPVRDEEAGLPSRGAPACRYCRTAVAPGDRFCGRCGMRIPGFDPVQLAAQERGELVCPDCGALGQGPRCRRCGGRMRAPAR